VVGGCRTHSRSQAALDAIDERRDELVELAAALIRYDTTSRIGDEPPREEADRQASLRDRLRSVVAAVEIWGPQPGDVADHPQVSPGLSFAGRRPQLIARVPVENNVTLLNALSHLDNVRVA
jgi:acetylornithine deacetylase/succinyl-diaminopimelate desuccinylase-like protein